MLFPLVLVFSGLACALPTATESFPHAPFQRRNETGAVEYQLAPLSETLRINGQRVSAAEFEQFDQGGLDRAEVVDIYTYAVRYRDSLATPEPTERQNAIEIPRDPNSSGAQPRLHVDYTSRLKTCSISLPQIKDNLPTWYCNSGDKCQKTVKLSTSQTEVDNGGYKVSASVKGKTKLGPVETEVTLGAEYNKGWSKSTTTSVEMTDTWTISYGQVCTPTSYQFYVNCDSDISVQALKLLDASGNEMRGTPSNLCEFFGATDRKEFVRGAGFSDTVANLVNDICASNSKTGGDGRINLDLKTQAQSPQPITIQGCNF